MGEQLYEIYWSRFCGNLTLETLGICLSRHTKWSCPYSDCCSCSVPCSASQHTLLYQTTPFETSQQQAQTSISRRARYWRRFWSLEYQERRGQQLSSSIS